MPRFLTATASFVLGAIFAAALPAQVTVTIQDTDSFRTLRQNGDTLTFDSEGVGRAVEQRLTIRYENEDNPEAYAQIFYDGGEPSLSGSDTFRLSPSSSSAIDIRPGRTRDIRIRFTPTGAGPFTGSLRLPIRIISNQKGGGPAAYTFNLLGRAAAYNLSFLLPGGNQTAVRDGGAVVFDDTTVDASTMATVIAANSGSGPGTITAVSLAAGDVFELGGVGFLPATIEPGRDFRFQVRFTPPAAESYSGSITLRFGSGRTDALQLTGRGAAAVYSYELTTSDGRASSIAEDGTIAVGSTPVGEEIVAVLTVTNAGSEAGSIGNISITGAGYSIPDRPLLPVRLDVGESFAVEIHLTPVEAGTASGQLRIGSSTFDLTAEALGEVLSYALTGADGPRQIEPRDPIVFPQTRVGDSSEMTLQISNSGNTDVTLSGVGVGDGAFSLKGLPALPASLDAEQTISVTVVFEPNRLGPQNASLAVNTATSTANFTLNGIGEKPDLSAVSFSNTGGAVEPADTVPLGLSIADPLPVDIQGALRLSFDSAAFSNDPSIQFSTGGRAASFTIPKGRTEAVFPGNLTVNPFLTGTVAGAITASATFAVADGRVDITPDAAPEAVFTVVPAAPSLRNLTLGNTGQGRFSVQVTGFATARSVSRLQIVFSGASGANLSTANLTADVADAFTLYYAGNQSSAFGSLFMATVNFTVEEGNFEDLSAVTITAENELGQSNPVSLTLN